MIFYSDALVYIFHQGDFTTSRFDTYEPRRLILKETTTTTLLQNIGFNVKVRQMTRTTAEFRAMSSHKRGCFYPDEKSLPIMGVYSQANCELECACDRAADKCGCVPWFLKGYYHQIRVSWILRVEVCIGNLSMGSGASPSWERWAWATQPHSKIFYNKKIVENKLNSYNSVLLFTKL